MEIKILTSRVGNNFCQTRGDEVDVEEDEALRMIDAGQASPNSEAAKARYKEHQAEMKAAQKAARETAKKNDEKRAEKGAEKNEPESEPLHSDVEVEALDLDETTLKVLRAAGLETAGQVAAHPDLTKIDGIGKATAAKINSALNKI